VELSAVGFNSAHSEAFFRADHFCGLCGGGGYVLMTKINGEWRVVKWDLSWLPKRPNTPLQPTAEGRGGSAADL
jgi:hypothetical protein